MNEHFIKEIEIKNYKCFTDFKAQGFARINLIGGKNNVGKTAFMEACYISVQEKYFALNDIVTTRYFLDIFDDLRDEVGSRYITNFIQEKINDIGSVEIQNRQNQFRENIRFISTYKTENKLFNQWYGAIVENSLEDLFDEYISLFDSEFDRFRMINAQPKLRVKSEQKFYNINELGDGFSKYISYVAMMLVHRDGTIFIDEIENGIHYTKLDDMWRVILKLSRENSVQIFATTHSKECIESYARVAKELQEKEIAFVSLYKERDTQIKSVVFDYDAIQTRLELDLDNR